MNDLLRQLPRVDALAGDPALAHWPRERVVAQARALVDGVRERVLSGELTVLPELSKTLRERMAALGTQRLRRVVNATGIVLHTNLGRAPMSQAAAAAAFEVARGYSNTEMELNTGQRGGRLRGVSEPLCALLGCQAAIAVNNGAAAVVLVLSALAQGKQVVVSRGELVEIGGSFRVPDIMRVSGAELVEVGTTNRTRAADFTSAIGERTALLMRIHPSNFRIEGFTERPSTVELAGHGVPLVEDLGSGALQPGLGDEPVVGQVLADGADLVIFSGDKLLGGPQAGIIAGDPELVQACRKHPLYRAMRLDKMVLAALEATLREHLLGQVPVAIELMKRDPKEMAKQLQSDLAGCGLQLDVVPGVGFSGGGALPGEGLPTTLLRVCVSRPERLSAWLREQAVPIVARVADGALLIDPRTLLPGEDGLVVDALRRWGDRSGTTE
jgi:L-seryl-tRNA(Ser) seleniumtransferase